MKKFSIFLVFSLLICAILSSACATGFDSQTDEVAPLCAEDIQTRSGLEMYTDAVADRNDVLIQRQILSADITATITFSQYLSFDEFRDYVEDYALDVRQVQVRGIADDGARITVFALGGQELENLEENVLAEAITNEFTILGVTDIYAFVNSLDIKHMGADERTYLVDTSGSNYITGNLFSASVQDNTSSYFPKSVTWELENLGLL